MHTLRLSLAGLGTLVLAVVLFDTEWVRTQEPPLAPNRAGEATDDDGDAQEGVEVLARGPIHEAFAEPVDNKPRQGPVAAKQPPDPIEEMPPDQKPEGSIWIPGYWSWDEERDDFIWVSGFWRVPPPDRQWMPGHWTQAGSGWQWVPGYWNLANQSDVTLLPSPPQPIETGPSTPSPGQNYVYVPGAWVYRERYIWRPGCWVMCRPGWIWVPAHYVWTPAGYVFVEGYWDYTLRDRGVLFAPVAVNFAVVRVRPAWYYRPRYVVYDDALCGAMFIRPGCGHYYFGDYYDPCYARAGYVSWFEFRVGGGCGDPLFSYYRWHHHHHCGDSGWEIGIRATFVSRCRNEVPRPPRTLIQQNTVINNINVTNVNVNNSKHVHNVKNVAMLGSMKDVEQKKLAKLEKVPREKQIEEQQSAKQLRDVGRQRRDLEAQALTKGPPPTRPTDAPRVMKVDLPKNSPTPKAAAARIAPPAPTKVEARHVEPKGPLHHDKPPPHRPDGKTLSAPLKPEPKGPIQPKHDAKGPAHLAKPPAHQPKDGKPAPMPKGKPAPLAPKPMPQGQPMAKPMPQGPPNAKPVPAAPASQRREPPPKQEERKKGKDRK